MKHPTDPVHIEPNAVYSDGMLVLSLGLTHAVLARERREGRLRFTRRGRRILYLGNWILEWLEGDASTREAEVAP